MVENAQKIMYTDFLSGYSEYAMFIHTNFEKWNLTIFCCCNSIIFKRKRCYITRYLC